VYPLAPGRLHFVPAGVRFSCRCTAARVGHFYIHFDVLGLPAPALDGLFARPVCLPPAPGLEGEADDLGAALSATADPARRDDLTLHCQIKALLYAALALHLGSVPEEERARCLTLAARLEPVRPALDFIEANLGARLTNAELAARCCLSEDHFARRFRECVGVPPGEWVAERRVRAAAQRLLLTGDAIERIAEETGFGNRYYFTRVFARRMGAAPAAYRKSGRL
jgi:AraC family transcriptional regulator